MNCEKVNGDDLVILLDNGDLSAISVSSFNRFVSQGIPAILSEGFNTEKTIVMGNNPEGISVIKIVMKFEAKKPEKPMQTNTRKIVFPSECVTSDLNYTLKMGCSVIVVATAFKADKNAPPIIRTATTDNFGFHLPVMTGSKWCNTEKLSDAAKMAFGEDPLSPSGLFVISGGRYSIDVMETRVFNIPNVFRNIGHNTEMTRLEILSKIGDGYENSSETIIRYKTDGGLYVSFMSDPGLKELEIPVQLIFRILGATDKEMFDNVVLSYAEGDELLGRMFNMMRDACDCWGSMPEAPKWQGKNKILENIADLITDVENLARPSGQGDDETAKALKSEYNRATVEARVDKYFVPHMGMSAQSRVVKVRYLGYLIRTMFLVFLQKIPETDRDSYSRKRLLTPDRTLSKIFKTMFNKIMKKAKKGLTEKFESMKFMDVPIIQILDTASSGNMLETSITKAIVTSGKDTARGTQAGANVSAQQVPVKNPTSVLCTIRTIRAPNSSVNNQSGRSKELRDVQPSQIGSACLSRTADTGPGVGLVKESVPGTVVAVPGSSIALVEELERDSLVIPHSRVFPQHIYERKMTMIFVNGIWVGCTLRPRELRIKYIELRRGFNLDGSKAQFFDRSFNIEFEHTVGEMHFWTDFGRIQCPRIIVRCNDPYIDPVGAAIFRKLGYPEFDPTKPPAAAFGANFDPKKHKYDNFIQDMMLTPKDLEEVFAGKKTTDDLHREGKIDYINPNELQNCYIAQDLDNLRVNTRNTLSAFTHVEIPSVAFGLMALTCPFINSDQAARTSMQTNQGKQAVSINSANHTKQYEKRAMGGDVDMPLVITIANVISPVSNTRNAMFMTGTFRGYNQEDSLVSNITASQRGMFSAIFMNTLKDKIEGASVGIAPGDSGKKSALRFDYSKLDEKGIIRVGAKVKAGDVLIAKYVTETSGTKDASMTHQGEPAQVIGVFDGFNKEGDRIIKIKIVIYRPMTYGDKFSSRHGQKGMNAKGYIDTELPHVDGISPTIIMSSFAYPTRMTIGHEKETLASTVCAELGCHFNASAMNKYDDGAMMEKAESLGLSAYADRTIYNGLDGRPHRGFTCGIVSYQRLMKWAADEHYAISHGNTDPITKQAVEGKVKKGGFRLGEMEKDVFFANGTVFAILEKFDIDSDGNEGYVCRNCGCIPVVNWAKSTVICKKCDSEAVIPDVVKTRFSWTSALLLGIINTMGIGVGLGITPNVYVEN